MARPIVSVFMPTYNHEKFVAEAISSAVEQDYDRLEIVVSDDGSSDHTVDIVLEYARKYPGRVIPLVDGSHLGVVGNSNRTLGACNGKYIAFHSGDDVFLPGKIRAQVDWLEADERRILCAHDVEIFHSDSGNTLGVHSTPTKLRHGVGAARHISYTGSTLHGLSVMVRVTPKVRNGYDERIRFASDWFFWVCVLGEDGIYGHIDGIYSRYRKHSKSITKLFEAELLNDQLVSLALIESLYPRFAKIVSRNRGHVFFQKAINHYRNGDLVSARFCIRQAVALDFSVTTFSSYVLLSLPERSRNLALRLRRNFAPHF